ncbi:MAG: PilT/PilU family type 4a pilus ATPase [Patescibacteria group bacterium]|nr:PilT/PilU family type 4a pilus ATPase [Patescibacteria group bacterium]MDE1945625.1 PilT/PilU family type 4a pilus ATPase [Patescibacteria group bacterium]
MTDSKSILADLVGIVFREGASDLHLAEGRQPVIRVAGLLLPLLKQPVVGKADILGILTEMVGAEARDRFVKTKELDFSYGIENGERFRGNAYYQQGAVAVALRLIPKKIRSIAELNLPESITAFADKPQGFFLVVGPVGHGKTTTLAALVEHINATRAEHIITIEDPIEYVYEPKKSIIDQREVRIDTADFATALQSMFREDVDVALIGEMRGAETIGTAVTAAETGHLVLSTLHTNTAAQTISRIVDSFPAEQQEEIRIQLAGSLTGILSQRLIPRISGGLIPAYELLINTNAVANLIRENRVHEIPSVIETSSQEGMIDMNRCLAELVARGEITVENAFRYASDAKVLQKMM